MRKSIRNNLLCLFQHNQVDSSNRFLWHHKSHYCYMLHSQPDKWQRFLSPYKSHLDKQEEDDDEEDIDLAEAPAGPMPRNVSPMLSTEVEEPFDKPG